MFFIKKQLFNWASLNVCYIVLLFFLWKLSRFNTFFRYLLFNIEHAIRPCSSIILVNFMELIEKLFLWNGWPWTFFRPYLQLQTLQEDLNLERILSKFLLYWMNYNISQRLFVQSQQLKQQNNLWNLLIVINKDTRIMSLTSFWCLYY